MEKFTSILVPLSKSCTDSMIEQVYYMNYLQQTMDEMQSVEADGLQNCQLGTDE
ncbi:hypothetical protein [Priestia megaterium]|uniref:hypothetical protein n=1 Tax=Priestia megaterium TaxID=1404 RepID=UPI003008F354